ncbi:hypothetical protein [Thioclava sp. GXIMD4215]|uniref:hypothetical protein n=1 Tax=Thioclava sp. GXIMD4215 TaxID=3131928 RepID=UPI0032482D12
MARKTYKRGGEKFVQLGRSLLAHWRRLHLSCGARSLHVELIDRYNGSNNGRIYLSSREAAELLGVTRNTIMRYYEELAILGFIKETRPHALGVEGKGRASEWRLTHLAADGKGPTRDFEKTEPLLKNRATPASKPCQEIVPAPVDKC